MFKLIFILITFLCTSNGHLRKHHKCLHDSLIIPRRNTSTRTQIQYINKVERTIPTSSTSSATERRRLSNTNMRFQVQFTTELAASSSRIVSNLIPEATAFWSSALLIENQVALLNFDRNCTSSFKFTNGDKVCHTYSDVNMCGDMTIPSSWLKAGKTCSECLETGLDSCTGCVNIAAGTGIPNKEFALLVSAVETPTCVSSPDTLGYAHPCLFDQYDRPILGMINFCPTAMASSSDNIALTTAKHEIAHALGFSSERFPYMRWSDSKLPRTSRDSDGAVPDAQISCADGNVRTMPQTASVMAGPIQIREFNNGFKLTTPNLAKAAKEHFSCTTEIGVELENQPTGDLDSCWGSHFEGRILHSELMTAVSDENSVVSIFTLAFFHDTGWYVPNYDKVETLQFGKGMGCDFLNQKCISNTGVIGKKQGYFCTDASATSCSADKKAKSYCNRLDWTSDLPVPFQYFDNKKSGGALKEMDYCPYFSPWSNGDCSLNSNSPKDPTKNYFGDVYAEGSFCVSSSAMWKGYTSPSLESWETCVGVVCNEDKTAATLVLIAEDNFQVSILCGKEDVGKSKEVASKFNGNIVCPDIDLICASPSKFIPSDAACPTRLKNCNSPHGSCKYLNDGTYRCSCADGYSGEVCDVVEVSNVPSPTSQTSPGLNQGKASTLSRSVLLVCLFYIGNLFIF